MIINKIKTNNRKCKECHNTSVAWQGNWEICHYCGEVYSKKMDNIPALEDIVLDEKTDKKTKYINKMFFFLSA